MNQQFFYKVKSQLRQSPLTMIVATIVLAFFIQYLFTEDKQVLINAGSFLALIAALNKKEKSPSRQIN